jgi:hypothetical protein
MRTQGNRALSKLRLIPDAYNCAPVLALILLLVIAPAVFAQSQRPLKSDTQFWNDTLLTMSIHKRVDFGFTVTTRINSNFNDVIDERWGAGWIIKVNKYLTFTPFYFHRQARQPRLIKEHEERLTLGATLRFPVRKFTLVERNLFERRWREPQRDAWRYRIRGQIEHPITVKNFKFTGYVSDEVFYDWSVNRWVRNRFAVGGYHAFNKHFTLDLYIMRQNDGLSRPGDLTVLGSQMRFRM